MARRVTWAVGVFLSVSLGGVSAFAATFYVAQQDPRAADGNAGTEAAPLKTITAALGKVQPGDTVWVKTGVYRESAVYPGPDWKDPEVRCTLSAFPGQRPVLKGSEVLASTWTRLAGDRPVYYQARDLYTQMVFVDERPLAQIGLQGSPKRASATNGFQFQRQWRGHGLADMAPGSFFYDEKEKRLYLWLADGADPKQHVVEAAVRDVGVSLRGTWTLRGLEVRHIADGFWPHEQAVGVSGNRSVVENCRLLHNELLGLIVSGEDCVLRGNEIGYSGLMGLTSNVGYRMLVEGNEFHHNAWRGDVVCLTAGNKLVTWRDSAFVRNWWHDEPASALWLDISDGNILIAENRFDNCACGIYFEICRWAVIANNVLRHCGRGIWSYSADVLIAHNVLDGCGEGITVSGYPRVCNYNQSVSEPGHYALLAARNNLVVNNILVDCVGSYIGLTEDSGFGANNRSDHNVFAWTLPVAHPTGEHLNFMSGWSQLYGKLPIWQMERHQDERSVVADPVLFRSLADGSPWVQLPKERVFAEVGFADRAQGDYRLRPDSPVRGAGVQLPKVLNSPYRPGPGQTIVSRQFARTLLADAPDRQRAVTVVDNAGPHYRLQPLPGFHQLAELDGLPPAAPGLNAAWSGSGQYPAFDTQAEPEQAGDWDWAVYPDNRLQDASFKLSMGTSGPWASSGVVHTWSGLACANLLPTHQPRQVATQKVGKIAPDTEYVLWGDLLASGADPRFAAVTELYLAAGGKLQPLGTPARYQSPTGRPGHWRSLLARFHSGAAGRDVAVGQDLYVVLAASVVGPADAKSESPVALARWDNLVLLTGEKP